MIWPIRRRNLLAGCFALARLFGSRCCKTLYVGSIGRSCSILTRLVVKGDARLRPCGDGDRRWT